MRKKHEFALGTLDGRKVGVRDRQIIYRSEAQKLIADLGRAIAKRTAEIVLLRKDATYRSISPLGAGVLNRIADSFENRNGPATEIRDSLSAIVGDLDEKPDEQGQHRERNH